MIAGELATLARRVASDAGELVAKRVTTDFVVDSKASHLDLVTEVDRASEELIVTRLLEARPNDGIIGEEGATADGTSGIDWLIDPIDGTTNFVYGLPEFSVSIAARVDGAMAVGVVLAPMLNTEYVAIAGSGTTHDERPVSTSGCRDLTTALVATGFNPDDARRTLQAAHVAEMLPRIRDIRRRGSAAIDLAAVAAGQVDAYYEAGLCDWDWAAGSLLVTEAGGRIVIERDDATGRSFVAASAPGIADELFGMLRSLGADRV